jgi:hypothetical protein
VGSKRAVHRLDDVDDEGAVHELAVHGIDSVLRDDLQGLDGYRGAGARLEGLLCPSLSFSWVGALV